MKTFKLFFVTLVCFSIAEVCAEQVYVIDKIKIGLHQEPSNQSPIIKLVPSGSELTVIERDNDLIHVEEAEGVRGWINTQNVQSKRPGNIEIEKLTTENEKLKGEITLLKQNNNQSVSNADLEQELKTERLKVGQLQVELTNIKSNTGNFESSEKLIADIDQLKNANQQLVEQLESSGMKVNDSQNNVQTKNDSSFTAFIIIFILGSAAGAFIIDYLNRRRHGGFRI